MPNWTINYVRIEGEPEGLEQIKRQLATKHNPFDFNSLVPMPKLLEDIRTGACTIDDERVDIWREGNDGQSERIPDAERDQLLAAYGADNWHDWTYLHWGTSWNACRVETKHTATCLSYTFDSAWAAPEPIAGKVRALCANLGLTLEWTAEDEDDRGWYPVVPSLGGEAAA